jgi:hypothetical protein
MSEKKAKKISYVLPIKSAQKQIEEASSFIMRAKSLLETYLCKDSPVRYKDEAVLLLAEHMTNGRTYIDVLNNHIATSERTVDKSTGEERIIVDLNGFTMINAYVTIFAACENELELLGISMRAH